MNNLLVKDTLEYVEPRGTFLQAVLMTILTIAMFASLVFSFLTYLDQPVVYYSYTTKTCAYVVVKGETLPCSEAIGYTQFKKVWIK